MYTTAFVPNPATTYARPSERQEGEIPQELLSKLMENAEQQIAAGDCITQTEMEKLVAAW